jgi:TonB-dependent receptor
VSAEDIGKFPDQNVAESLQRLPGISIDRSNGQGTKARIRGLDQNVTLLNDDIFLSGLELYTQGEGNVRKADSLEGIPSELLGGIDVYKSPNASQSESGLGGIINLKTRSPFPSAKARPSPATCATRTAARAGSRSARWS